MTADSSTRAASSFARHATRGWLDVALLVACVAVSSAVSIALGQDANWDLQNYHFYGPWALLAGRAFGWDIAAAQLQTYFNPLLDLPFYAMVANDWDPRIISAVLALPAGVAAWLLAKLAWALFGGIDTPSRLVAAIASLAIGLTAAMAVGTLGMTMNDWPGTALALAALWLLVRAIVSGGAVGLPLRTLLAAGALIGVASGLKLTVATFAAAMCIGLLLRPPHARARLREAFVFGAAVLAGLLVVYAYWGWQLWTHFGNPVFPFANQWFASPWWEQQPVYERIYGPHNLREWLRFPLALYSPQPGFVTEVPYADPRIPLTYVLALVAAASLALQRAMRIHPAEPADQPPQVTEARALVGAVLGGVVHPVGRAALGRALYRRAGDNDGPAHRRHAALDASPGLRERRHRHRRGRSDHGHAMARLVADRPRQAMVRRKRSRRGTQRADPDDLGRADGLRPSLLSGGRPASRRAEQHQRSRP